MAWRRVLSQIARHRPANAIYNELMASSSIGTLRSDVAAGFRFRNLQERNQSSYIGSLARRMRELDAPSETSLLKEIYRSDPERVIQIFESQPSLHSNPSVISEYVKALVKVDRLDESTLLKTLQRGVASSTRQEGSFGSIPALQSAGQVTKDGILGTASAPIHMFTAETGLGLNEEVQPSMESSTKFSDVKGVDEAKSELKEIVHYLRDPMVLCKQPT